MYDETRLYEIDFSDSNLAESELAETISKMAIASQREKQRTARIKSEWHYQGSFMMGLCGGRKR